jgi:hypothetical protein
MKIINLITIKKEAYDNFINTLKGLYFNNPGCNEMEPWDKSE